MASYQRIALYIFFDAIERDLVRHIRSISNQIEGRFLASQERDKAIQRFDKQDEDLSGAVDDFHLLHHLDLGDKISIIQRYKSKFESNLRKHLTSKQQSLQKSIPIRNSLMHGRPLTVDEHAVSFALANDLVRSKAFWPNLEKELREYNADPDSVTRKAVSFLDDTNDASIFHNLPLPDYDDTGFVPRPALEQDLQKKIHGRHPVITVLGDGGNGKTALTLQSLYGLINSGDHSFEAVVWVSAKSSKLTVGEIRRIEHAITSSLGMFDHIVEVFGDSGSDSLTKVRQLLANNKILLVVDNLETVLDESIRDFATDVPGESKIVFTSRVPVGGDLTVAVGPLTESESETYLRALIKAYGISSLSRLKSKELRSYAKKLGHKPLLLKWFCFGVIAGQSPTRIVANPDLALRFCLENVFDALSTEALTVLSILSLLPRAVSLGVLHHVSEHNVLELEAGLAELLKFTIVEVENLDDLETNYKIKAFARAYVNRVLKLTPERKDEVISRFRGLSFVYQNEKGTEGRERYKPRNYTVRSISEALAVQKLRTAQRHAVRDEFQDAHDILEALKISHSDYFEVYRTEAFVKIRQQDVTGANDAYETAIDLEPEMPQIHYFYGGFFLRSYNDCKSAIARLEEALRLDPTSTAVKRELARNKMFNSDFSEAEKILSEELDGHFSNLKSKLIFSDLRLQNFQRMISHLATAGIDADLQKPIESFLEFLTSIDAAIVDDTMLQHMQRASAELQPILLKSTYGSSLWKALCDLIRRVEEKSSMRAGSESQAVFSGLMGSLKEQGRKPTFGFLVETSGREAFLLRSLVGTMKWEDLCSGAIARYDVEIDEQGRYRAVNVSIVKLQA